ncbi:hypothetical protein [Georgenia satyanarayanai]|uniref:hypothetical protein n=1 Tax=Georgenia satyanarayanai TaxID=860221 RepID=UPI0012640DD0|nr:hypothetical protein [Georgenia satyanarayanai]
MLRVALLGSVFLPALVLEPLARELELLGSVTAVVGVAEAPDPARALAAYEAALAGRGWDVVVAHSNAGLYVPALAAQRAVGGAVLVDAALPAPAGGHHPVVPAALRGALAEQATDGLLPRWTEWWPAEDVRALFPTSRSHAAVHAATPRVPLSYLDGTVAVPAGWTDGVRGAYLAFGDTYADERRQARSLGWPTRTLPLGHLGLLTDPAGVARAVHELAAGFTRRLPA